MPLLQNMSIFIPENTFSSTSTDVKNNNNEIVVNSCINTGTQGFLLTMEIVRGEILTLKQLG